MVVVGCCDGDGEIIWRVSILCSACSTYSVQNTYRAGHIRVPRKANIPFGAQIRLEGIESHARALEFFISLSTQHQYQYSVQTQGTRQCHLEEQTPILHFTP
jgi:hypothetical protein